MSIVSLKPMCQRFTYDHEPPDAQNYIVIRDPMSFKKEWVRDCMFWAGYSRARPQGVIVAIMSGGAIKEHHVFKSWQMAKAWMDQRAQLAIIVGETWPELPSAGTIQIPFV